MNNGSETMYNGMAWLSYKELREEVNFRFSRQMVFRLFDGGGGVFVVFIPINLLFS